MPDGTTTTVLLEETTTIDENEGNFQLLFFICKGKSYIYLTIGGKVEIV